MTFDHEQPAFAAFRDIVSERSDGIVAWLGAGMSAPAGLPGWRDLRDQLCEQLRKKIHTISENDRTALRSKHDAAAFNTDLWAAFSTLEDALGPTSFVQAIRDALIDADSCAVPEAYHRIWNLGVKGVLTLNIDRLVARAYAEHDNSVVPHEFSGDKCGSHAHVLKNAHPFIANLHGTLGEKESWVFTNRQLRRLLRDKGYQLLIKSCLASRTILFAGISAEDVAAGGHLHAITTGGIDVGTHFWVTDRTDRATDTWAEKAGLQIIRYKNADGKHTELAEFFDLLGSYVPRDREVRPVTPVLAVPAPTPGEPETTDGLRRRLNHEAAEILRSGRENARQEYDAFCKAHSEQIWRAWFVSTDSPSNELLGYQLSENIAAGGFGTVYSATNPQGHACAVKLLHPQLHSNRERLDGFRRGVASMEILSSRDIDGIVGYHAAYEIPAMVVMDLVDGLNVKEAYEKGLLNEWGTIIEIAFQLATIIRNAHRLPERVLHRDIRPANIMLSNCWTTGAPDLTDAKVVVLDFDLSWHVNARGVSILEPETTAGFLAPELIYRNGVSTRSSAVDSFGLGMTLYSMRTRREPMFAQHKHKDWMDVLKKCEEGYPCHEWQSLPRRFFGLVASATRDLQSERCDMTTIEGEIGLLREALNNPEGVSSTEHLGEEFAARLFGQKYVWDHPTLTATYSTPYSKVRIQVHEPESTVEVSLQVKRDGLKKYLSKMRSQLDAQLKHAGFVVDSKSTSNDEWSARASVHKKRLAGQMDQLVLATKQALEATTF